MQNFSERLRQAIADANMPKGQLAGRAGVALSTVSRWLGGAVPSHDTLACIAKELGVSAQWLLYGGDRIGDTEAPPGYGSAGMPAMSISRQLDSGPGGAVRGAKPESILEDIAEAVGNMTAAKSATMRHGYGQQIMGFAGELCRQAQAAPHPAIIEEPKP